MFQNFKLRGYLLIQLLLLPALVLILAGCSKKDNCEDDKSTKQASVLIVTPTDLELSGAGKGKVLLSTYPATKTHWEILSDYNWLMFKPNEGDINMDIVEIEVSANLSLVEEGVNSAYINVITNSIGKKDFSVYYHFDPDYLSLTTSSEEVDFDFFDNEKAFYIRNSGLSDIQWEIIDDIPYISLNPLDGFLEKGDSVELNVTLDRSLLSSGTYSSSFQIIANEKDSVGIEVSCKNYIEEKWFFNGQVIDAEYNRNIDKIIVAIGEPTGVKILDPVLNTEKFLSIPETPLAISVRPQGDKAAVVCENIVYNIDLTNLAILDSWSFSLIPDEVIYGDGEMVYIFHSSNSNCYIVNMNMNTGETHTSLIGDDYKWNYAQLHTSHKYMYVSLTKKYSSYDIYYSKYDLTNDTAEFMYMKQLPNNSYGYAKGFWITDDGLSLITGNRLAVHISSVEEYDLTPIGTLPVFDNLDAFEFADSYSDKNIIATIIKNDNYYNYNEAKEIAFYKNSTLQLTKVIQMPDYFLNIDTTGVIYDPVAEFVFFNSQGDEVYILLQAEDSFPVYNDWSVYSYDLTGVKQ